MSLYYYKKAKPQNIKGCNKNSTSITVATLLDNIIHKISKKFSQIKPISFIAPLILVACGSAILYRQAKPFVVHFVQSRLLDRLNQEITPLVPESYENIRAAYIYDPGASYFSQIIINKEITQKNLNYEGIFYLTIKKAPVTANVDSSKENFYQNALSKGLAHFKGTDLPGGNGNILIYGHSAAGDYAENNPKDPVTAFTRLFKLNIGDEILVEFENSEYLYKIKKIKEVNPEEVDILNNNGIKTLTLMTCSPPGLNSKRLVVTAIQQ
jgi:LPXTG-site transpeptidase (sortase) family protein